VEQRRLGRLGHQRRPPAALLIGAEQRLAETNLAEAEQVLAGADDYSSPFLRIPF
jgi:hypothetical protein